MEAILQQAQGFLSSGYGVLAIAAMLLAKTISTLRSAFDFHDKNFVEKRFKRLNELRVSIKKDHRPLAQYLDDAIELEAFRVASGVSASRQKMEFLLELSSFGIWNRAQLRRVAKYLSQGPEDAAPTIQITWLDRTGATISLLSLTFCVFAGIFYFAYFALTMKMPYGLALGVLVFSGFIVAGSLLGEDYSSFRCARDVGKFLASNTTTAASNGPAPLDDLAGDLQEESEISSQPNVHELR